MVQVGGKTNLYDKEQAEKHKQRAKGRESLPSSLSTEATRELPP